MDGLDWSTDPRYINFTTISNKNKSDKCIVKLFKKYSSQNSVIVDSQYFDFITKF